MQSGSTPDIKDNFSDLATPNIESQTLDLQKLIQQGVITPDDAKAALVGDSATSGISLDPKLKAAQLDALSQLQNISGSGGLDAIDRSKLDQISTDEAAQARGGREAILQNAQMRGAGGSGIELLAQLQNQQDSASRKSARDTGVAAEAQQRALDSLMQGANLSGQIMDRDTNLATQKAGAQDAIAKFNAQNQQQANLANTQARNVSQAQNLAEKQRVADSNTGIQNQQQQYNKELIQKQFDDELKKRTGQTGVASTNAAVQGANSAGSANATNQTIGTALTAAAIFSDQRAKKDISEFSPSDFLDSLTSYKYKYKDPKHGEGDQVGVMAQDLQKTDEGSKLVVDTPEGKFVDYGKSGPAIMASLADINKRLKKMEAS